MCRSADAKRGTLEMTLCVSSRYRNAWSGDEGDADSGEVEVEEKGREGCGEGGGKEGV